MYTAYFTSIESEFARALKAQFEKNGYSVTTELRGELEFFIDTTEAEIEGDDREVGCGIRPEVGEAAYEAVVCVPLRKLQKVMPYLGGRRRICFLSSVDSSINMSEATAGYGKNMSKAALHQILTVTKNTLVGKGYTFRLFDPMTGTVPAEKAAASAYVYFTRDRFNDGPDNPSREDEQNLILRNARGVEIPW